jgi:hypothetical protein
MMTKLMSLMMQMMSPCAAATRLASESLDRPLTAKERRSLRMHLLVCQWCRRYEKQIRFLHEILHRHPETFTSRSTPRLSAASRERIRQILAAAK